MCIVAKVLFSMPRTTPTYYCLAFTPGPIKEMLCNKLLHNKLHQTNYPLSMIIITGASMSLVESSEIAKNLS